MAIPPFTNSSETRWVTLLDSSDEDNPPPPLISLQHNSGPSSPPTQFPASNFFPSNPSTIPPDSFSESSIEEYSNSRFASRTLPFLPSSRTLPNSAAPPVTSTPAIFTSTPPHTPQPFIPPTPSAPPIITNTRSCQIKQAYLDQYGPFDTQTPDSVMRSHYAKEALSLTNRPRNRYRNIIPYQQSIFKFQNSALYFNASRVLQGRAISCQGPLENEHAHFWRMVWESNTTAIVMLTDLDEKGVNKCSWYLPTGTEAKLPPKSDLPKELEITVTQTDGPPKPTSASTSDSFEFFQRRIELYYKDEKRTVVHYHLRGWHDFTAAPHATLANLVKRVWDNHFSKGEHIISHCSAGIGRSGTFLAILGALSELQNTPLLTNLVINIVTKLRSFNDGREGMVQTAEQYGLIFKTLAVLDANCAREFCVQTSF